VRALAGLIAAGIAGAAAPAIAAEEAPAAIVEAGERSPLLALVLAPLGTVTHTPASEIYRAADGSLRAITDLFVVTPEQAGVDMAMLATCPLQERFACWVRTSRAGHEGVGAGPRHILVLSVQPLDSGNDEISAFLIDTEDALKRARALEGDEGWKERLENEIYEASVETQPRTIRPARKDELARYFDDLFSRELANALGAANHFEPYGQLDVVSNAAGIGIEIDGRLVGTTAIGTTRVRELRAKSRRVVLNDSMRRYAPFETRVDVHSGEIVRVEASLIPLDDESPSVVRRATLWSGVALVAGGAVLTGWAIAGAPSGRSVDACTMGGDCAADRSFDFATFCDLSTDRPGGCAERSGVLVAPLGIAMIAAGGAFSSGSLLFENDDDLWIAVVAGALAGGAAYAFSAIAD
jgi:hypothetical protein